MNIWESTPSSRIHEFMDRKDRQFPELNLLEQWDDMNSVPGRRSYGNTSNR